MRILYRYNGCTLDLESQVLQYEDPTIINADYCTAPSWNTAYLTTAVVHHPTYSPNYALDGADRVEKSFASFPQYQPIYYWFMSAAPFRSVWVDSDCNGVKDALSAGSQVTIGKSFTFTEDQIVTVGIFGDNQFQVSYDGEIIVSTPDLGPTFHTPFNRFHLFEIQVTKGNHYFAFTGTGDGSVNDSLGVVLYNHTVAELLNDADPLQRNEWDVLYSSEDSLSESVDIVVCPDGYSYDNERELCVKIHNTENPSTDDLVLITPTFDCTNLGTPTNWIIDYGDSTTESGIGDYPQTFEHQYNTAGTYTITLTVYYGTRPYVDSETITVVNPNAIFEGAGDLAYNNDTDITVQYPTTVEEGDLLIAAFGSDSDDTYGTISGWTLLSGVVNPNSDISGAWYSRIATGSEPTFVSVDTSQISNKFGVVYRFSNVGSVDSLQSLASGYISRTFTGTTSDAAIGELDIAITQFRANEPVTVTGGDYIEESLKSTASGGGFTFSLSSRKGTSSTSDTMLTEWASSVPATFYRGLILKR